VHVNGSLATTSRELKMFTENQNSSDKNSVRQQNGGKPFDTATMSGNGFPAGFQAIATAYGDYAKRSFEDSKSFVGELSSVRSVDKLIQVQTEFARTVYETFVEESRKIGALYGDLANYNYDGFLSKMPPTFRGPVLAESK
jgi:hypothetical protein